MPHEYWEQPAELFRKMSRTDEPDAPILRLGSLVANGALRAMVERWGALSPAERLHHVVLIGGGSLSDSTLAAMLERCRIPGTGQEAQDDGSAG